MVLNQDITGLVEVWSASCPPSVPITEVGVGNISVWVGSCSVIGLLSPLVGSILATALAAFPFFGYQTRFLGLGVAVRGVFGVELADEFLIGTVWVGSAL